MKITHNKVGQNLNLKDSGKAEKTEISDKLKISGKETGKASLFDSDLGAAKVDLSDRAQDMKRAQEVAAASPDVDEAKVARLQKMIDEGKYNVSSKDIADKMVDEELMWS
ncbi:MAG: flagellar biosynthesis anti-sigma factor FlgM [Bdellovibrio sp. CG10_big_fil_rev_8_21_14_0_10_47_8]|nr:MAG: flagellar biosynthesis anti-sigma factor FlgM [Bdellovibrio sp. CG10_big_fil_rev_8_21_14_0_10_47_8]